MAGILAGSRNRFRGGTPRSANYSAVLTSGWTVGQNVRVDYRWSGGNADNIRKYAAELVALAPDVILAHSSQPVAPLLQASRTVPIVFTAVSDPVGAGYVESLALSTDYRRGAFYDPISRYSFA